MLSFILTTIPDQRKSKKPSCLKICILNPKIYVHLDLKILDNYTTLYVFFSRYIYHLANNFCLKCDDIRNNVKKST